MRETDDKSQRHAASLRSGEEVKGFLVRRGCVYVTLCAGTVYVYIDGVGALHRETESGGLIDASNRWYGNESGERGELLNYTLRAIWADY